MISENGSLPIISILVLAFSMLLITEVFKLKKVQRRLVKKIDIMKKELDALKGEKRSKLFEFFEVFLLILYTYGKQ